MLLSLSIHERRSRNPCAVRLILDGLSASAHPPLRARRRCAAPPRRDLVLARPIQFSKNRPRLEGASLFARLARPSCGIQATAHPAWSGVPNRYFRPCSGEPSYTTIASSGCQHLVAPRQASLHSAKAAARSDVGRPSVVVSDLGARTAGNLGTSAAPEREQRFDERRRRTSILRAGGGSCQPSLSLLESHFTALSGDLDPGARHATTASHTVGQWLQTPLDYDLGTWMSTGDTKRRAGNKERALVLTDREPRSLRPGNFVGGIAHDGDPASANRSAKSGPIFWT